MTEPEALLDLAGELARTAGAVLLERFGRESVDVQTKSTPTDPVSEADHAAERAVRTLLAARRPDDAILGEEQGGDADAVAPGSLRWVVDPLDGTVNYLFGIPHWCVSVACEDADGTVCGVVHDPLRAEDFSATRAGPPTLNGAEITASTSTDLATALVATGFSYDAEVRVGQAEVAARVLPRVRDLRRLGSAALDLAWMAAGRYDAYYERALQPWDAAAGALLCARAGLELRELPARGVQPAGLLAAPPALAEPLLALVTDSG